MAPEKVLLLFDVAQLMREIIPLRSPATAPEKELDAVRWCYLFTV
jgi:hypothetical protein